MDFDVIVIGGGPAGLAAAIAAEKRGAKTLLVEREARLGGILKQCIHDGFGLIEFGEKLAGTEYAERFVRLLSETKVEVKLLTFVTKIEKTTDGFTLHLVSTSGVSVVQTRALVLATGCRERTARQVFIQGTRPAGIFTAGTAQNFVNLAGKLPTKRCVILGSGDIGLIMARRLTLEGAEVEGVYEVKPTPSGLTRNIHQCLLDFDIPLHLSTTVTRVFGDERLSGVEVCKVDEKMQPVAGTERRIDCDALILSVGLIPENELAETLGAAIDRRTKGPLVNQQFMTSVDGLFSAGNALHVNDLVDYVTECARLAGDHAAAYASEKRDEISFEVGKNLLYVVPQKLDVLAQKDAVTVYFRSAFDMKGRFFVKVDGAEVFSKKYAALRPPEMEKLVLDFQAFGVHNGSKVELGLEVL